MFADRGDSSAILDHGGIPPMEAPSPPGVSSAIRGDPQTSGSEDTVDASRWREAIHRHYDREDLRQGPHWARYYHRRIVGRLKQLVEPGSRVLDIGCDCGDLLAALKPAVGVGVDISEGAIRRARARHPNLRFIVLEGERVEVLNDTFDYVILSQVLGDVYDLPKLLDSIQRVCHAGTRLILVHYNRIWQPILRLMEWLRLKPRGPEQNWLPSDEVIHLLSLSGFETIHSFGLTIAPVYVPLFSAFLNRVLGNFPLIHHFGLNYVVVARSIPAAVAARARRGAESVSIIVPARNEAGHIAALLRRIPQLAPRQEVVLVEGGSRDETWAVIQQAARDYAGPFTIHSIRQVGTGKGDAVRTGFDQATGDILMILDADLSVPPEELPLFYETLVSGKGELINGSRMVYLMDKRAMRFLNILGNKVFGWLFTYLLSQRFRDTLCGTKAIRRRDYLRVARNRTFFGVFDPFGDFDLLFGAARLSLKIIDVPVHYKARTYGKTNISRFRHGWLLLRMSLIAARKLRFV
jgi:ubiquinone/menaquinone biosynthesis C-methylase UbiE